MRKFIKVGAIVLFIITFMFTSNPKIYSKNLKDVKAELAKMEEEARNNKAQQAKTESEIKSINAKMNETIKEIEFIQTEYDRINLEVASLEAQIKEKDSESKQIIEYLQLSTGENAYLDYAFTAKDPADLIFRISIVEQLTKYNTQLIEEMNDLIKQNKAHKVDLQNKEVSMGKLRVTLIDNLNSLGETKEDLADGYTEIESDIKELKSTIKMYEELCDNDTQELSTCGKGLVNTTFRRPTSSGRITSEFGYRYLDLYGYWKMHYGIDVGAGTGTSLYSIGSGIVTSASYESCGGNTITIIHKVNGNYYTSQYLHLSQIFVKKGDNVTSETLIGKTGNTGTCTTGPHLHLALTTGARYVTGGMYGVPNSAAYTLSSDFNKRAFNPRNMINFPAKGVQITSR